jgi:MGT family glycosyltransferase
VLKYAAAAITHAGMNSMSDLLVHGIPFVSLPMGADQPELAARAEELGATISLDVNALEPEALRNAVERVMHDPSYLASIKKISESFKAAGGYPKAVDEIFELKRQQHTSDPQNP